MRGYLAVTPAELAQLLTDGEIEVNSAYVPTSQFQAANPELGEEEAEYILSLLASEDSVEIQEGNPTRSFVLAVDLNPENLGQESEVEIEVTSPIKINQVDCLFVGAAGSEDGELTWYALQEIEAELPSWVSE